MINVPDKGIEVGDVVKVIGYNDNNDDDVRMRGRVLVFSPNMEPFIGETHKVARVEYRYSDECGDFPVYVLENCSSWLWTPFWIELVSRGHETSLTDEDFSSVFV